MSIAKRVLERIGKVPGDLDVNAVLGEPQTVGETTVVPVAEMVVGFGLATDTGCCSGEDEARGGGHAHTRPLATIEVGPEGTHVQPIVDTQRVALAAALLSLWVFGWLGLVLNVLLNRERT